MLDGGIPGSNEVFNALAQESGHSTGSRAAKSALRRERGQVFTVYYGDSTLLTVGSSTVKTCFPEPLNDICDITIPQRGGNNDEGTEFDDLRAAACVRRNVGMDVCGGGGGSAAHRRE